MKSHLRVFSIELQWSGSDVGTAGEQLELAAEPVRPKRARGAVRDTSRNARALTKATSVLCERIYTAIAEAARDPRRMGATADEVHETIAATTAERDNVRQLMNVRRRVSDLAGAQRIRATLLRRQNAGGIGQIVWAPSEYSVQQSGDDGVE